MDSRTVNRRDTKSCKEKEAVESHYHPHVKGKENTNKNSLN